MVDFSQLILSHWGNFLLTIRPYITPLFLMSLYIHYKTRKIITLNNLYALCVTMIWFFHRNYISSRVTFSTDQIWKWDQIWKFYYVFTMHKNMLRSMILCVMWILLGLKFSFHKTNVSNDFQIVLDTQIDSHFVTNEWILRIFFIFYHRR